MSKNVKLTNIVECEKGSCACSNNVDECKKIKGKCSYMLKMLVNIK
jgi:hypothetical protein